MTWGGFLANDWRAEEIGVGVYRCPGSVPSMSAIEFARLLQLEAVR